MGNHGRQYIGELGSMVFFLKSDYNLQLREAKDYEIAFDIK